MAETPPAPQTPLQPRRPSPPARRPATGPPTQLPPGGAPPGEPGAPRPADRERAAVAVRRSNLFVLLALAALVTSYLPLPWGIVGIAIGIAALVVGLMAVIAAMDARLATRRLVALWVSLAVIAVFVLVRLLSLAAYPYLVEKQDCRREAITRTAAAAWEQGPVLAPR